MCNGISEMSGYYGMLPTALAVLSRAEDGSYNTDYANPAAEKILSSNAGLIGAISGAVSDGVKEWRGEVGSRSFAAKTSSRPDGRVIVIIRDITDDLKNQQDRIDASMAALRSALDAANAANQAKTDFLSNMSHDIRTPLNAIIGMTTIAQAHLDERERLEDCLEKISLSSKHLLAIINDILDMSRIESGKMSVSNEPFALADFIHSLMAVFRPQADAKRQKVELDFSGIHHEHVSGDWMRMQQVLVNILSNAVKFTPEGGISLTIREGARVGKADRNYAYYEFVVQDNGIGMNKDFLDKIFLPFERDKGVNQIQGTGLGMAITHNLVKIMNGEISVESEAGRGTKFTVSIPLEQLEDDESGLSALRGLKVLAADSDTASLHNLKEILSDLGMEYDAVESGWEAQDLAARAHVEGKDYFAVMLGWHLSVVDGVQTCGELRAMLGSEIPIILMSAFEWTMSSDEMRKRGISAFVPKPLFRSRLAETLYAYTDSGRAKGAKAGSEKEESFEGYNILLVEDNELNSDIALELISMLGATVECAEDGKEALDIFSGSPKGRFDLIFMDIQMPVMNGYEATRAIRALPREDSKQIPIVAMSANAFVEDIRACRSAGMNAHVPKPVSLASLVEVMKRFLKTEDGSAEDNAADPEVSV